MIVSDAACGEANPVDPGLELAAASALYDPGWTFYLSPPATVRVVGDAGRAHTGTGLLELVATHACDNGSATSSIRVPAPTATEGPALKFWANVGVNPNTTTRVTGVAADLPEGGGWQEHTGCLDPALAGRPAAISVGMYGGSGLCGGTAFTESALFDDFRVTTDPSCPTM